MKKVLKKEIKETKNKKSSPTLLVIVGILVLVGVLGYRFLYKGIRTRISNYFVSKSLSKQLGGDVKIEGDGEKVSYKGEDFEFSYDMGGDLPEGFPKDIPIYKDSNLLSKWSSTSEGEEGISVVLESADSLTKVSDFYKVELEKTGWTVTSSFLEDESSIFSFEKEDKEGILAITTVEDKVNISITINNK
ncbi:MAG: hypothetical protein ABIJ05_00790 [Patescibacteria group bacterium]